MAYNEKSKQNLKPFHGANDPRRQNGRRKGQLNRTTIIRDFLSRELDPRLLVDYKAKEGAEKMKGKTCLEAILYTLANQALREDTRASDILLRELRHIDKERPLESSFFQERSFKIEVVQSQDEYERLKEIEQRLMDKYGKDYTELDG